MKRDASEMDMPVFESIYLPNFNLDTRHNTVLIQESGQATMETNGRTLTGGSNLEVFPGQPRASGREEEGRGEGGWGSAMTVRRARSVRPAGRTTARKWVRKREGARSWLQCRVFKWSVRPTPITTSTPEHPRYPCLMPKGPTPSVRSDTGVRERATCPHASTVDLSHVESRNGNMQLGRQASLRRLENSKDLPRDPPDRCRTSKDLESPQSPVITCPSSKSATLLHRLICCL